MNELVQDNLTQNAEKFKNMDKKILEQTLAAAKSNKPVSDDLMIDSLHTSLEKYGKWPMVTACLVEGFPRNLQQATDWNDYVRQVQGF